MNMQRDRSRFRERKLSIQTLEARQLLAADVGGIHNVDLPEDVNGDGEVTAFDALMVMNVMGHDHVDSPTDPPMFRDVTNDGKITSLDALRVMNRIARDRLLADEARPEVRSIDGTHNNLADPTLGSTDTQLRRLVNADYADGISEPNGADRPSAHEVSNIVAAQEQSVLNDRNLTDLVWQWGQFIDHDITLSEAGDSEAFNIAVPSGDAHFDPSGTGTAEIELMRSAFADGTGIETTRQQVNGITAFIDGSMVYGSDHDTATSLRSFTGGRMLTSQGDLLPVDDSGFFMAGDERANEQNGLTAMHTLWVREHNRVADEIASVRQELGDEQIYQLARAFVIGEIQAITFNEYLPTLLGPDAISPYDGYDPQVDPSISNLFATAAFRYGHTSLSSELKRLDDDGNVIAEGNLALRDAFFNPSGILAVGIDPLLKGLASNLAQEIDTQLVDDVRNFLFGPPGAGGFDLAALNIQRGRDHGLPDYNSVREQLGLPRAESFSDISSDPGVQAKLEEAYGSVDDIDVWVGALAEDHVAAASVGELVKTVLVEQFTALRDGDRFWYQNIFAGEQLDRLQQTRLSDVIERNTELTSIQDNAFVVLPPGSEAGGDSTSTMEQPLPENLASGGVGTHGPRSADDPPPPQTAPPIAAAPNNAGEEPVDDHQPPPDDPALPARPVVGDTTEADQPRGPRPASPVGDGGLPARQQVTRGLESSAVDQVLRGLGVPL